MRVTAGTDGADGADVTMRLLNADGSVAEMSGNGIRCLAQAVFQAGLATPPVLRVATDAGLRTVTVLARPAANVHRMSVEMGQAKVGEQLPEWVEGDILRAVHVDVGNPHVVLHWGGEALPGLDQLVEIGARIDSATPGGANVEIIAPGEPGRSEEHTSELQSLMRISYAVFCLKKKKQNSGTDERESKKPTNIGHNKKQRHRNYRMT